MGRKQPVVGQSVNTPQRCNSRTCEMGRVKFYNGGGGNRLDIDMPWNRNFNLTNIRFSIWVVVTYVWEVGLQTYLIASLVCYPAINNVNGSSSPDKRLGWSFSPQLTSHLNLVGSSFFQVLTSYFDPTERKNKVFANASKSLLVDVYRRTMWYVTKLIAEKSRMKKKGKGYPYLQQLETKKNVVLLTTQTHIQICAGKSRRMTHAQLFSISWHKASLYFPSDSAATEERYGKRKSKKKKLTPETWGNLVTS